MTIASMFGACLGFYHALELVTNFIASKINFASKNMCSTIFTKLLHSKKVLVTRMMLMRKINVVRNLVVNAMTIHNLILVQTIEIQNPILVCVVY